MKQIELTQEKITIVDDDDYEKLNEYKWCFDGNYAVRGVWNKNTKKGSIIRIHREIMDFPEGLEIDHINRDKLDNRRCNLRTCTRRENALNMRSSGITSKFVGVSWNTEREKWVAQIKVMGKTTFLGRFINEIDAANAYNNAAIKYHKEFAKLNKI